MSLLADSISFMRDLWPIVNSVGIVLLAIIGYSWRQLGEDVRGMRTAMDDLKTMILTTQTSVAVTQSQLQSHTEQDRQSFHEVRNDLQTRTLELTRRLDEIGRRA